MSVKNNTAKSLSPDQARKEYFPMIGRATFYDYINRGLIPHIRFGRKIIITRNAMDQMMENGGKSGPRAA
jgi:hypothetical protein